MGDEDKGTGRDVDEGELLDGDAILVSTMLPLCYLMVVRALSIGRNMPIQAAKTTEPRQQESLEGEQGKVQGRGTRDGSNGKTGNSLSSD